MNKNKNTKIIPKERIGKSFCGVIWDSYQDDWKFLEYLGDGFYLVCRDRGHCKSDFRKIHINEIQ